MSAYRFNFMSAFQEFRTRKLPGIFASISWNIENGTEKLMRSS